MRFITFLLRSVRHKLVVTLRSVAPKNEQISYVLIEDYETIF
jgi:hypothetical protein